MANLRMTLCVNRTYVKIENHFFHVIRFSNNNYIQLISVLIKLEKSIIFGMPNPKERIAKMMQINFPLNICFYILPIYLDYISIICCMHMLSLQL